MKRISAFLACILLTIPASSMAEKIYYKDGRTSECKIIYRSKGVVWIESRPGSVGINITEIDKIEDDDGSMSKFDYDAMGKRIQELVKEENYKEAIRLCDELLKSIPDNTQIRYLRGMLSQKVSDIKKAEEDYGFLVKANAADAAILNNLGTIYARDEDYRQASDLFLKAVSENPKMVEVHENLALLSMTTKDYTRAMDEYNAVIEKDPDNMDALYNLGILYMSKGDYPKARALWGKVLSLKPDDSDTKKALEELNKR